MYCFFIWLVWFGIIILRFIHVGACINIPFYFLRRILWHDIHGIPQLLAVVDGHLGYLQFLIITNKAAMNIHMQVFVWTYMYPFMSGVAVAYGKCTFNFTMNFQIVFQSAFTPRECECYRCSTFSPILNSLSL